jgi:Transposase IS66 family
MAIWKRLIRFLDYPELELSNNLAENSMRGVALGRNYVHSEIMCSHEAKRGIILRIYLRRFRELIRVCFPEVTHLTCNQACN